jgi:hypothetical protein
LPPLLVSPSYHLSVAACLVTAREISVFCHGLLSSALASNFPAIKLLCFAEENSARLTEANLTCRVQAILSKATLRADLVAALERISGSVVKQPASPT